MNIKSRIHRTIQGFDNFHEITEENTGYFLENLKLKENEVCYGVYENIPKRIDERIAITNRGMYFNQEDAWLFINFLNIEEVNFIGKNKANIKGEKLKTEHLTLELVNGKSIKLPIRGRKGEFKDIFEFMRFLMRVLWDFERKINTKKIKNN